MDQMYTAFTEFMKNYSTSAQFLDVQAGSSDKSKAPGISLEEPSTSTPPPDKSDVVCDGGSSVKGDSDQDDCTSNQGAGGKKNLIGN